MNIRSEDLVKVIERERAQGSLSPLWIILGDEPLLALEAGDLLRKTAKDLGCPGVELYERLVAFD